MGQQVKARIRGSYRIAQLRNALRAELTPEEVALVATTLTEPEQRLFDAMPRYDQRHCLDVHHTLVATGYDEPVLQRAALIHDCGKVDDQGRPMALGWYVVATILKQIPGLYLAVARHGGVLQPIRIYAEHAWRGAEMAAKAGSPPVMVEALRHYHDPNPTGLAALLKWADEQH